MLCGREKEDERYAEPVFGVNTEDEIPTETLRADHVEPRLAYRMVKDELMDEGNARQNLATFCQSYMEDEATMLMAETLEKNAIDQSEYPRTAELESRCVRMIANLWNVPQDAAFTGTSTVGSSEACMLGGLAMKFSWRARSEAAGLAIGAQKPNLVISSGYQVCWEKFCVYWDIEMRCVPMDETHTTLDIDKVMALVDPYTIGIVGILGITYTGGYDDIAALDQLLTAYNATTPYKVYIHVDAASGGMYAPFVQPELVWDFRLANVVSINTSGHKYGLVYPGIGWILWKDEAYLPRELVFNVSYLGGEMPTMAINFSRSASPIIGQYYNFIRFGFNGYRDIHCNSREVARYLSSFLQETGLFRLYSSGEQLPVVCYTMKAEANTAWTLYDLSDRLQMKGWQVPTYPLSADLQDTIVQRYVCRADLPMHVAREFVQDFKEALEDLQRAQVTFYAENDRVTKGFTH
ncbi:MAG: glutamate decarboxylase [Lachnospiraceae bacterium]